MFGLLALFRMLFPLFKGSSDADIFRAIGLAWAERPGCLTSAKQDEAQLLYAAWSLYQARMQQGAARIPVGIRSEKEGDLQRTYGTVDGADDPFGWRARYDALARLCAGSITVGHRWRDSCCGLGFSTDPSQPAPDPSEQLAITGEPVTSGTAGQSYSGFVVTASGGFEPYGYFVVDGPVGMTVDPAGTVAWSSMVEGSYRPIVRAIDSHGAAADLLFDLSVTADGLATPVNTERPSVVGVLRVGETVTVDVGDWANNPDSYAIQWLRGGMPIPGATNSTYQYTLADVNIRSSVRVIAINQAGPSQPSTSLPSTPVGVAVAQLQIAGVPALGIVGQPYAWGPEITGGAPSYSLASTGAPLPDGLSVTGLLVTGVPTSDADVVGVILTATDSKGEVAVLGPFPFPVDQPGQDMRPRFGVGSAQVAPALESMTPYEGSFTAAAPQGQYLWVASTSPLLNFSNAQGTGAWQGVGYAAENFDDQNVSPNTGELTTTIDGVAWYFYRANFPNGASTWTTSNG